MKVLGIETSCDETAVAVVEDGHKLLSNVVASSVDLHAAFGGVVPEVAARSHIEYMLPTIDSALSSANLKWGDIDAIAVTQGPGLIGSLLVGVMTARTLAITKNKPLYAVNHVMAHPFAAFITDCSEQLKREHSLNKSMPQFPVLALVISGGHTQLFLLTDYNSYNIIGQTTDDAIGEAYDKVAKILGLPYPGGPAIDNAAKRGNESAIKFPVPKTEKTYNFSYSGLKTAVLREAQKETDNDYTFPSAQLPNLLTSSQKNNLAASFQYAAVKMVVDKLLLAVEQFGPKSIVIAGGVAANSYLRQKLQENFESPIYFPDIKLCTDNAAMVATHGYYLYKSGVKPADPYKLEAEPSLRM